MMNRTKRKTVRSFENVHCFVEKMIDSSHTSSHVLWLQSLFAWFYNKTSTIKNSSNWIQSIRMYSWYRIKECMFNWIWQTTTQLRYSRSFKKNSTKFLKNSKNWSHLNIDYDLTPTMRICNCKNLSLRIALRLQKYNPFAFHFFRHVICLIDTFLFDNII